MPLPAVVESSLVVVVELRPGVRVAASWTGRGRYVKLLAQAGTGQAIALDSWWVWDESRDCPAIEATLPALESFVMERLAEAGDDKLLDAITIPTDAAPLRHLRSRASARSL
jgi:hypothetical protein